jgi:hypothetical protein
METILHDVNLEKLLFLNNGRDIEFTFIDAVKGEYLSKICCYNLIVFNFCNILDEEFPYPCYIGEVNIEKLDYDGITNRLLQLHFQFKKGEDILIPECKEFSYLEMLSGEIEIKLLSKKIDF